MNHCRIIEIASQLQHIGFIPGFRVIRNVIFFLEIRSRDRKHGCTN